MYHIIFFYVIFSFGVGLLFRSPYRCTIHNAMPDELKLEVEIPVQLRYNIFSRFFSPFLSSFDPFTWFFFIVVTLTGYSILKFIFILLFFFSCWCDLWYFMVCNRLKNIYKYNLWACVCLVLVFSTSYFFLNGHFIFLVDDGAADEVSECFKSPRDIDVYSFSFLVYAHTVFLKSSSICSHNLFFYSIFLFVILLQQVWLAYEFFD